jgi:hypothetical protein
VPAAVAQEPALTAVTPQVRPAAQAVSAEAILTLPVAVLPEAHPVLLVLQVTVTVVLDLQALQ